MLEYYKNLFPDCTIYKIGDNIMFKKDNILFSISEQNLVFIDITDFYLLHIVSYFIKNMNLNFDFNIIKNVKIDNFSTEELIYLGHFPIKNIVYTKYGNYKMHIKNFIFDIELSNGETKNDHKKLMLRLKMLEKYLHE